jgi:hypothetical protein
MFTLESTTTHYRSYRKSDMSRVEEESDFSGAA